MDNSVCHICKINIDDPVELGDKIQINNVSIHYFCMVSLNYFHLN